VPALICSRLANQRILELESQVDEFKQHFSDLQQQLRKAEEEKETKDAQLEERKASIEEHSKYSFRNDLSCDAAVCVCQKLRSIAVN
jgi:t-SNARE complex subunit (syntaxin)